MLHGKTRYALKILKQAHIIQSILSCMLTSQKLHSSMVIKYIYNIVCHQLYRGLCGAVFLGAMQNVIVLTHKILKRYPLPQGKFFKNSF